jgi:predicted transcriptional regulator
VKLQPNDYVSYRDPQPEALSAVVIRLLGENPGLTAADVAINIRRSTHQTSNLLVHLEKHGWVVAKKQKIHGAGTRPVRCWYLTKRAQKEPYQSRAYTDTADLVKALLATGAYTLSEVATHIDRPYDTIRSAIRSLLNRGVIERYDGPDGVTYAVVEDDGWTPQQFVSSLRVKVLPPVDASRSMRDASRPISAGSAP